MSVDSLFLPRMNPTADSPQPFITPQGVAAPGTAGLPRPTFTAAGGYLGGVNAAGVIKVNSGNIDSSWSPLTGRQPGGAQPNLVDSTVYLTQLQQYFYVPELRPLYNAILVQMQQAGIPEVQGSNPTLADALKGYQQVLLGASYNSAYTPNQYLQLAAAQGSFKSQTPGPTTQVSDFSNTSDVNRVNTNITGPLDAKALVNSALGQFLGRQATPEEQAAFRQLLNEQERTTPSVTTGTSESSGTTTQTSTPAVAGSVTTPGTPRQAAVGTPGTPARSVSSTTSSDSQNTTTSGGIDSAAANQLAEDYAKAQPTYAGTQANTTLMSWLQEAILGTPTNASI